MENLLLYVLIGINAGLFALTSSSQQTRVRVVADYAAIPQAVKRGEWYRLITSAFLHNDIFHVFLNMYSLFALFPTVIAILKNVVPSQYVLLSFLSLYLFAAITAGILSSTRKEQSVPSLGASGAVFGLLGFLLAVGLLTFATGGAQLVQSILFVLLINFGVGLMPGFNIDNRGHLGGLIGGLVFGAIAVLLLGLRLV
jgi:rhomboid protease GluP